MTREDEINKAAIEEASTLDIAYGFKLGAEWADKNPKSPWILCSDQLPKERHRVWVLYFYNWNGDVHVGGPDFGWYEGGEEWDFIGKRESDMVVAWMPIPELLKFD